MIGRHCCLNAARAALSDQSVSQSVSRSDPFLSQSKCGRHYGSTIIGWLWETIVVSTVRERYKSLAGRGTAALLFVPRRL